MASGSSQVMKLKTARREMVKTWETVVWEKEDTGGSPGAGRPPLRGRLRAFTGTAVLTVPSVLFCLERFVQHLPTVHVCTGDRAEEPCENTCERAKMHAISASARQAQAEKGSGEGRDTRRSSSWEEQCQTHLQALILRRPSYSTAIVTHCCRTFLITSSTPPSGVCSAATGLGRARSKN